MEIHADVRVKDQKMNQLQSLCDALQAEKEEVDPHKRERMKFDRGERADKMQQTAAHYNPETDSTQLTQPNGAWMFVSMYESRV